MTIEEAAGDPALVAVARLLLREYEAELGIDLGFQGFEAEVASLPGDYAPPSGCLLLARDGEGLIAGCVALRPLGEPGTAELKRLYVRPAARGVGIARRLVQVALDAARGAGHRRVVLDTLPAMAAAQGLYASLGFSEIAPYTANPVAGARFMALELRAG